MPFTPVTGPRLMLHPEAPPDSLRALAAALRRACEEARVSSCHVTFNEGHEGAALAEQGFLPRLGMQYQCASLPANHAFGRLHSFIRSLPVRVPAAAFHGTSSARATPAKRRVCTAAAVSLCLHRYVAPARRGAQLRRASLLDNCV